jgi:hypothetical protein
VTNEPAGTTPPDNAGLGAAGTQLTSAFKEHLGSYAATLTANFASLTDAQPEDQLKAPVSEIVKAAGELAGLKIVSRTETKVDGIAGRPDIGVDSNGLPVGNIELKAPGNGARPELFKDKRSRDQFERFSKLPNLLYTDGRDWALYRNGSLIGEVIRLDAEPTIGGTGGVTDEDASKLLNLLGVFFRWEPIVPSSPRALATLLAPLTRLLRDEVLADVKAKGVMQILATEWRNTLFPDADDPTFADSYAQTFVYALLLARLEGAEAPLTAETAAKELDADHALLAQALRLLGQPGTRDAIGMPVGLLERVVGAVDPSKLASENKDPWIYFYEDFLAAYDPVQRNNRGVYFTPFEVVNAQVRLSDFVIRTRFAKEAGLGSPDVVVLDPAAGTGTYPLAVVSQVLQNAADESGPGVVPQVATHLVDNINAFEILVGPYAVTHLRLSRTFVDAGAAMPDAGVRVFLTDALTAPAHSGFAAQMTLFQQRLAAEQENAGRVKDVDTVVTVIIGNPPYDRDESQVKAGERRKGGIVRYAEDGSGPGMIEDFLTPLKAVNAGVHAKNLYNDYVYFWRWAIWKACEQNNDPAIVNFITASSYLTGPGFAGMREMMRREFDEIWLLDLGGEGRGTRKDDNVFFGVQTPVVIAVAIRISGGSPEERRAKPATVRYRRVTGTREDKYAALNAVHELDASDGWEIAPDGWLDRFVPIGTADFDGWPLLLDLMPWQHSGVKAGRTWVIDADATVLHSRWEMLLSTGAEQRTALFKDSPTGRKAATQLRPGSIMNGSFPFDSILESPATQPPPKATVYGFRSFDRSFILEDPRLIDRPGYAWSTFSERQVYLVSLVTNPISDGPAVTATASIPDLHCYRGSFGAKDVIPLWRDAAATDPNVTDGLVALLSTTYGDDVSAEDIASYVFGLLGTGSYAARFADELAASTPRVPITADKDKFWKVVELGRDLLWWATYGERLRPNDEHGKPRFSLPSGTAKNTVAVSMDTYPETYSYSADTKTITVGDGEFGPVEPEVWQFQVSGLKVVQSWLGYRMKVRSGKKSSPLDEIRPKHWTFSAEFVKLLAIIEHFVEAEARAAELLERVVIGPLIDPSVIPAPSEDERKAPKRALTDSDDGVLPLFE